MKIVIRFSEPCVSIEEKKSVINAIDTKWFTTGKTAMKFEKALAKYTKVRFVKVLNSCTSALELALLAVNVKQGDEVITTPFTFCATTNAIVHSGAKPVFADIDRNTFNISPVEIEKKITKRTKVILIMDYGGLPCDMDAVISIAKRYKLRIVEDAAHAIGAEYKRKKIGSISDITCFSFHASKNITTGEGGALCTNDKRIIDFINKAYFHGIDCDSWQRHRKGGWKYRVVYPGYKYNMSDIMASIGIEQLKKLDYFIKKREKIVTLYNSEFREINVYIRTQFNPYEVRHAHHLYPILLNIEKLKIKRDKFIELLKRKGIMCSVHFIPIYKHPAYKKYFTKKDLKDLKNTEYVYNRIVSLPIYPGLVLKDVRYITSTVKNIIKRYKK